MKELQAGVDFSTATSLSQPGETTLYNISSAWA